MRYLILIPLALLVLSCSAPFDSRTSRSGGDASNSDPGHDQDVYWNGKTRFGVILSPANHPDCTFEDFSQAMQELASVSGHASYMLKWADWEEEYRNALMVTSASQSLELITILQIQLADLSVPAPPDELPATFADPDVRARYVEDVERLASLEPDYLNLAAEINLLGFFNPEEFEHYTSVYRQAYGAAKAISPGTKVGVSYHLHAFFGATQYDMPGRLGPQDFYGVTSYPSWTVYDGHYASVDDIPTEYYDRLKAAFFDGPILITEIGWTTAGQGSAEDQARFIQRLPELLRGANPRFVTWPLLHDVRFFDLETISDEPRETLDGLDLDPAVLFEEMNGVGLLYREGPPKPGWHDAGELVFDYPAESY